MRPFLFLTFVCLSFLNLQAQPSSSEETIQVEEEKTGEIVFIRDTGIFGSAIAFRTFVDENLASRINNKRYTKHTVEAGTHEFSTQFYGKKHKSKTLKSNITVEAGKTHYVLLVYKMGFWTSKLHAVEITEASAQNWLGKMKEDKKY